MKKLLREIVFRIGETRYHYTSIDAAEREAERLLRLEDDLARRGREIFLLRCELDRQIKAAKAADTERAV